MNADPPSGNVARAARLVEALARAGVSEWCVCPGGRNSPLVVVLDAARGARLHRGFEERSTAFFALGRARATRRPVAVVTTSGTAAAELLPAAVEGHYAGAPLVLVTADRPPAYRGTGAPQAIEQVGLYGPYAPTIADDTGGGGSAADALTAWRGDHPVHVNVCFDEPLVDGPVPALRLAPGDPPQPSDRPDASPVTELLAAARRPLVLVGPLDPADRPGVREFLLRLRAPAYLEAASGLREDPALAARAFLSGEGALGATDPDAVLRLGGVPTVRFWRDLETRRRDVPVCAVSRTPFTGLTRATLVRGRVGEALRTVVTDRTDGADGSSWLRRDRERAARLDALLAAEPASEPGMIRALSTLAPPGSLVYLGNSLPIREWDLAAVREARGWDVAASRGANGIDGQVSTFFGWCGPDREHWGVVGDLTGLYDLAAPWMLSGLEGGPIRLVVVNNGGGQIFARLSSHAGLRNAHGRGFADWARMWDLAYHRWSAVPAAPRLEERCVIELAPRADATDRFWRTYDAVEVTT